MKPNISESFLANGVHGCRRSAVPYNTLSCSEPPSRSFSGEKAETKFTAALTKETGYTNRASTSTERRRKPAVAYL